MTDVGAPRRSTHPLVAVLVVVLALLGPDVVVAVAVGLVGGIGGGIGPMSLGTQVAFLVAPFTLALLLLGAWVRLFERRPFATLGFRGPARAALPGALAGGLLFGLVVAVAAALGQVSVGGWNPAMILGALVALLGFAVQGSAEEIACRGFLMQAMRGRWGGPVAVGGQAVVFAALHLGNPGAFEPLAVPNLLLFACFLAGWTLREGGLWGACAWHATWNWVQGNVFGAPVSGNGLGTSVLRTGPVPGSSDLLTGGSFGLESSVITTVVLAVGTAVVFLLLRRGRLRPDQQKGDADA